LGVSTLFAIDDVIVAASEAVKQLRELFWSFPFGPCKESR
jgi:hypothetical protein